MSAPPPPVVPSAAFQPGEKRGDIHFATKDAGLRKDVHDLGVIVGQLLEEQGGATLFGRVEEARRAAIDAREGDPTGGQRLEALVAALSPAESQDFIRAFSTYFLAVNLAETVHRIRRRRDYLREGKHRQPGGFEDTLFELKEAGVSLDEVGHALATLHIEPVLTAHPTEPTRRTILRRQTDIVRRLIDMQNAALSPRELSADLENIRDDITAIWQTEEHPTEARTVAAEHEHVLFFLTDCIYRVMPAVYETCEAALGAVWGEAGTKLELPVMVRLASWIGGDMVGRGEITARTIRATLARQRALVLDLYHRECRELAEKLSQSTTRVGVSAALSGSSAYTWLKIQATDDIATVAAMTTQPLLLLGGTPGPDPAATFALWERCLAEPSVRGLVIGRSLLYPPDGDVAGAVATAARLVEHAAAAQR